jgi:cobalt-zinc-cadmium resistance protein CzcA
VSQAVDRRWRRSTATCRRAQAVTVYDRTVLVDKAIATVKNLLEGAIW